jgi:hypothetical protein
MDLLKIFELSATIITIIGILYTTIPKRVGLYWLIVGTILWGIYAILNSSWFLLSQEIFLIFLNIIALKNWKNKGID